jgi:hypothetical protein
MLKCEPRPEKRSGRVSGRSASRSRRERAGVEGACPGSVAEAKRTKYRRGAIVMIDLRSRRVILNRFVVVFEIGLRAALDPRGPVRQAGQGMLRRHRERAAERFRMPWELLERRRLRPAQSTETALSRRGRRIARRREQQTSDDGTTCRQQQPRTDSEADHEIGVEGRHTIPQHGRRRNRTRTRSRVFPGRQTARPARHL